METIKIHAYIQAFFPVSHVTFYDPPDTADMLKLFIEISKQL